jgi:protein import protein ZIM17
MTQLSRTSDHSEHYITSMSLARTAFRSVTAGPSTLRYIPKPALKPYSAFAATITPRSVIGNRISHRWNSSQAPNKEDEDSLRLEAPKPGEKSQPIGRIEPRLYVPLLLLSWCEELCEAKTDYRSITMTCTANDCNHRSTHEFTKKSYQKGIVIIQCPSCKERYVPTIHIYRNSRADDRHLIADNLGWFNVCLPFPLLI